MEKVIVYLDDPAYARQQLPGAGVVLRLLGIGLGKVEQPGDLIRRKAFDSEQMPVGKEGGRLAGGVAH